MQLVDKILSKCGIDRILHFSIGGLIAALFGLFGWISFIIGVVFVFLISIVKEYCFDSKVDWVDIAFAMYGVALVAIVFIISIFV